MNTLVPWITRITYKSKSSTAAKHFPSPPDHAANDIPLIPIEKIFSNWNSIRKARETFLIQKGRTIDPDENIKRVPM